MDNAVDNAVVCFGDCQTNAGGDRLARHMLTSISGASSVTQTSSAHHWLVEGCLLLLLPQNPSSLNAALFDPDRVDMYTRRPDGTERREYICYLTACERRIHCAANDRHCCG